MKNLYHVHCDCNRVKAEMKGEPRVHAFCHGEDCRELLQVPYHSVLAWESEQLTITEGQDEIIEFQHPTKRMKRIFCKHCGDVIFNTNAMGWKIVSQLFFRKSNDGQLPIDFQSNAHFFYAQRIIDIDDQLVKRE